jgi:hypothetical protein
MALRPEAKEVLDDERGTISNFLKKPIKEQFEILKTEVEKRFVPDFVKTRVIKIIKYDYEVIGLIIQFVLFPLLTFFVLFQYLPQVLKTVLPYMPYSWLQTISIVSSILLSLGVIFLTPNQEEPSKAIRLSRRIAFSSILAIIFYFLVTAINSFPPIFVIAYASLFFCFVFLFGTSAFVKFLRFLTRTKISIKNRLETSAKKATNSLFARILNKLGISSQEEIPQISLMEKEREEELINAKKDLAKLDKEKFGEEF